MAWIESHQSLRNHRKTITLRAALGVKRVEVIGLLHCLWWWAVDNAPDGNLAQLEPAVIAEAAEYDGDPVKFIGALKSSGFMSDTGSLHDWDEYAGRLIEDRLRDKERKKLERMRTDQRRATELQKLSSGCPADVRRMSTGFPGVPNPTQPNHIKSVYTREETTQSSALTDYHLNPPTIDEYLKAVSLIALPEEEKRKCFDYFNAQGWLRGKSLAPISDLQSITRTWKTEWEARASKAHQKSNGRPVQQEFTRDLKTRLDETRAMIQEIKQRGFEDAMGITIRDEDKARYRELCQLAKELRSKIAIGK